MIIYKTTNLINGKIYIGQSITNNPDYLGSGNSIRSAIKKYGKQNFKKEVLCECSTQDELNDLEVYYIKKFESTNRDIGYNLDPGGSYLTNEVRKKISNSLIGKSYPKPNRKGIHLSKEHRKKISLATKGKSKPPFSIEHRRKMSENAKGNIPWNRGKKTGSLSEEHRKKIGDATRGKSRPAFSSEWKQNISNGKKGKPSKNKGKTWVNPRKWMNDGLKNKFVHLDLISEHLDSGWKLGRLFSKDHKFDHVKGRIWIHNESGKSKMIEKSDLDKYPDWSLGRKKRQGLHETNGVLK